MTCAIDEAQSMLLEAGFSKPFTKLTLEDKSNVYSVLINYHCMTKVKAAMDQYIDGLESLDVLESVRCGRNQANGKHFLSMMVSRLMLVCTYMH